MGVNTMKYQTISALCLEILMQTSLASAETPKFGIQAAISKPQGDLDRGFEKMGYGFGIHSVFTINTSFDLVPRIDYLEYNSEDTRNLPRQFNHINAGLACRYYFREKRDVFLLGELGYSSVKYIIRGTESVIDPPNPTWTRIFKMTGKSEAPYFGAGAGYILNDHSAIEIKYSRSNYGTFKTNHSFFTTMRPLSASSIQTTLLFTF